MSRDAIPALRWGQRQSDFLKAFGTPLLTSTSSEGMGTVVWLMLRGLLGAGVGSHPRNPNEPPPAFPSVPLPHLTVGGKVCGQQHNGMVGYFQDEF